MQDTLRHAYISKYFYILVVPTLMYKHTSSLHDNYIIIYKILFYFWRTTKVLLK